MVPRVLRSGEKRCAGSSVPNGTRAKRAELTERIICRWKLALVLVVLVLVVRVVRQQMVMLLLVGKGR